MFIFLFFAGCETDFKEIIEKNDFFSDDEENSANKEENSEKESLAGAENKAVAKQGEKGEATQNTLPLPNKNINLGKAEGMNQQIRVLQNQVAALEEKNQGQRSTSNGRINFWDPVYPVFIHTRSIPFIWVFAKTSLRFLLATAKCVVIASA